MSRPCTAVELLAAVTFLKGDDLAGRVAGRVQGAARFHDAERPRLSGSQSVPECPAHGNRAARGIQGPW